MSDRTERLDAIEEQTQNLYDIAERQVRTELEDDYLKQYGLAYVRDYPFKVEDGVSFDRMVLARMTLNAQLRK